MNKKWEAAWNDKIPDMILNRTTGFIALMKYLKYAYNNSPKDINKIVSLEDFSILFETINIKVTDLSKYTYKPGGSGIAHLYRDLLSSKTSEA